MTYEDLKMAGNDEESLTKFMVVLMRDYKIVLKQLNNYVTTDPHRRLTHGEKTRLSRLEYERMTFSKVGRHVSLSLSGDPVSIGPSPTRMQEAQHRAYQRNILDAEQATERSAMVKNAMTDMEKFFSGRNPPKKGTV